MDAGADGMGWWSDNWIAVVALAVSIAVALANALSFLLRAPRVHWVLDSLTFINPPPGYFGPTLGRFVFRNAGQGTAHLTTVKMKYGSDGWLAIAGLENLTIKPEETFQIQVMGELSQRAELKMRRSAGDNFWFSTDDVLRVTWTYNPTLLMIRTRRRLRLQALQETVLPTIAERS